MSDIEDSMLLSTDRQENWKIRECKKEHQKQLKKWRNDSYCGIYAASTVSIRKKDEGWLLYLNTFLPGLKQVLNFLRIHKRKDNKNLWPSVFNIAWGKLLREVVDSSSHEVTGLGCLCQNGGWIKWQEWEKTTSFTTEPWELNYSPPRLPLNPT